jgi:hypothetical protein
MQSGSQTVTEYLSKSNFQIVQESGGLQNRQRFWNEATEDQRGGDILNQTNSSNVSNPRLTPRRDGIAPSASRSGLHSKSSDRNKKMNASQYSYANVSAVIQNN